MEVAGIDPIAAMLNPLLFTKRAMTLAAFVARALWWRQVHAFFLRVTGAIPFHRPRWASPFAVGVYLHAIANPHGELSARAVAGCNRPSSRQWKAHYRPKARARWLSVIRRTKR